MPDHDSSRSRSESRKHARKERKSKDKKEDKRDKPRNAPATDASSSVPAYAPPKIASPMPPAIDGAAILGAINGLDARFAKQLGDIGADVSCVKSDVGIVREKVDVLSDRVQHVETSVAGLQSTTDQHSKDIAFLLKEVKVLECNLREMGEANTKLKERVCVAESQEPVTKTSLAFDRVPDPTIIKTNCKASVTRDAVSSVLAKVVSDAGLEPDCFHVKGDAISRFFTIQFKGTANIASVRTSQVLDSLKSDEGWKRVLVPAPDQKSIQLYLGPDKSPKRVQTEIMSKKLFEVLDKLGVGDLHLQRRTGQIYADWKPLAMVEVVSKEQCNLLWDADLREELKINKDDVLEKFKCPNRRLVPTQWSS